MRIVAVLLVLTPFLHAEDELAKVRKAAEGRNRTAMRLLGEQLAKTDPAAAERWLRLAQEYGDRAAYKVLASLPEKPGGGELVAEGRTKLEAGDTLGAIVAWRRAIRAHLSRDAALALGDLFARPPLRSYTEALDAYRLALHGGRLAEVYDAGRRLRKDHPQLAASLMGLAAYESRQTPGVLPPDKQMVAAWEAEAAGDVDACATFGMYCRFTKQHDRSLLLLWQAAEQGNVEASYYVVDAFERVKDTAAAKLWTKIAAERGQADALTLAAFQVARSDQPNSVPAFEKAAAAGSAIARTWVGVGYMQGKGWGVAVDAAKAEKHLRFAAEQRNPLAMRLLGVMLARDGNETEGWHWLARAAEMGNKEARENIQLRAKEKRPIAMFHLGRLGIRGIAFKHNPNGGLRWIKAAAEAGCEPARAWLKLWGP